MTDAQALDAIAEFLNQPGSWNGGDVCEVVAETLTATGRRVLELDEKDEPDHLDVTPDPQPYRDGMFVSVCSCGEEFLGKDPDDADAYLEEHRFGTRPCGCPSDVITSTLGDGGEQCSRCGTTWDRDDQIITRRGEHLPRVGRRSHA
ncbi:hypothetical protein ACFWUU_40410 [Kribbella sp. NPDC058693]|uniref:hypothetical protein n=1 Tax=Kribbella sp. NPDC058693 TaxID=3346602 RepID=UPI00364783B4